MMKDLKAAAEEIKAIVRKYDLAAMIVLQNQKAVEYVREISPSWSCAKFEQHPDGYGIRIQAKRASFPSIEAHIKCIAETTGMFMGFEHQAQKDAEDMQKVIKMLAHEVSEISNIIGPHLPEDT